MTDFMAAIVDEIGDLIGKIRANRFHRGMM